MKTHHYPDIVITAFEEAGEALVEFMIQEMTPQCKQALADYLRGILGFIQKGIEVLERDK